MNINLHIERLVLDGVDVSPKQSQALQASLATEITRMLAEEGLSLRLSRENALHGLLAERIQRPTSDDPIRFGRHIAQSVYREINHE